MLEVQIENKQHSVSLYEQSSVYTECSKLFVQINTEDREHQNKYISLWYIWSLTVISDVRDDLHRR